MKYIFGIDKEGPITDRVITTENYAEFCQKASTIARRYLSPARAKAIVMVLNDFEQGGTLHMDDLYMEGRE